MRDKSPHTFREWLADAMQDADVSKRGLARRLAERHPQGASQETIESSRRTLRKILKGEQNPTQPTRDSIQAALGRKDAPSVEQESADAPTTEEARAQLRAIRRQTRILERALGVSS